MTICLFCFIFIDSQYRTHINAAVLKLQETGRIQELKKRWWKEKNKKIENITCQEIKDDDANANELKMVNVVGVFLVLIAGLFISILVGILEFLWNVRRVTLDEKVFIKNFLGLNTFLNNHKNNISLQLTPYKAFIKEAKFALNLRLKRKPVYPKRDDESQRSSVSSETNSNDHIMS